MKLTIFFDGQFWVGLIERQSESKHYSSLFTFGEEPGDSQIFEFVNNNLLNVINKQSEFVETNDLRIKKINPKRQKRIASKEMTANPLSTKSQEAIQKQLEQDKKERKLISKEQREEKLQYKREKAIEKRKQKHKGK